MLEDYMRFNLPFMLFYCRFIVFLCVYLSSQSNNGRYTFNICIQS